MVVENLGLNGNGIPISAFFLEADSYLMANKLNVKNLSISSRSGSRGTGILMVNCKKLEMNNSNFGDLDAKEGGALYLTGTKEIAISKCNFTNNSASQSGGGVFIKNGYFQISGSRFTNNSAGNGFKGGAIFTQVTASDGNSNLRNLEGSQSYTISDSTFELNQAGTGGAIYNEGFKVELLAIQLVNNSASVHGADIQDGCIPGEMVTNQQTCEICSSGRYSVISNAP